MQIAIPRQTHPGETRVALTPSVAEKLISAGHAVVIESGAGEAADAPDSRYEDAGVRAVTSEGEATAAIWGESDVVLTVNPPSEAQLDAMRQGSVLVGLLDPVNNGSLMQKAAEKGITTFALELVPRITRAQAMDVLSSQANLAGYKATLLGADHAPKIFPMMTTAAGTIRPSKVLVIGTGVAGLQAIATASRLGALVEGHDIRSETKEQVQSLGARFLELPDAADQSQTEGGYVKGQSAELAQRQQRLMAERLPSVNVVIATAAIFGKAPPMPIDNHALQQMQPGSVIVDIAANARHGRGNCEATRPGETYTTNNAVTIIGRADLPTTLPVHASAMFASNMQAFLKAITGEEAALALDMNDEVQGGAAITHNGEIVNETVKEATSQA